MPKYANIVNGVVDSISLDPPRVWIDAVIDEEDGSTTEPGHYGDEVSPPWVLVSDDVFGGFLQKLDGSFEAPLEEIDLADLKSQLSRSIDTAAEVERRKYITPGSGQAMTYMQKADEAARYLAAVTPDPDDYALLSAEVGITAPTLAEVADIVNAAFVQWQVIGGLIEATRLGTKAMISAAATPEDARAAAAAANWPQVSP